MITIKLLGGAKKSFATDQLTIDKNNLTLQKLLEYLLKNKPKNTPEMDVKNILVAVNGVDSAVIEGQLTKVKAGDVVTIIPIIHGGSNRRIQINISNSLVELMEVPMGQKFNIQNLDELRKKFPNITIQGISTRYVLSKSHAKKIISISLAAKKNDTLLSKKLETDILMRFACTTQISLAIKTIGIKQGKGFVIIAIGRKSILEKLFHELKPFLSSKPLSKNNHNFLQKHFKISKKQMNSTISKSPLEDLLAEKAAVLV